MAAEPHPPRVWTSTTGTTVEARLVEIGESTVTLARKDGGAPLKVRLDQLSEADQAYLGEVQKKLDEGPIGATSIAGLDAAPGEIRGPITCKDGKWSYSRTMTAWMKEMVAEQPWEAAYWADFLKDFPGDPVAAKQASGMFLELASNPQVELARDAEKDIRRFYLKHYNRYINMEEGKKTDPGRAAEAKKLAAKYPGLPHAEILERLGDPS
jgi:hypothetical protein